MKRYKVGDIVQIRQWDDMVKELVLIIMVLFDVTIAVL